MTVDDTTGSVTIYSRGRSGLYADDQGVIVRDFPGRARRIAWGDISHFADGSKPVDQGADVWVLQIVLRSGGVHRVGCTAGRSSETMAAVLQVAEQHGIPAELTGIKMKDGRPTSKGLFEDPGGLDGVRYWDGSRWSPLLAPFLRDKWFVGAGPSAASWAGLPVAEEPWDYPAIRAARAKAWTIACCVVIAALLVAGPTIGLVQHSWDAVWAFWVIAANVLWGLIPAALVWRFWKLVKRAGDPFNTITTDDIPSADLGVSLADDGLPSSKAPGNVLVVGIVTCAVVPAGVVAAGFINRGLPAGITAIGMVVGFLPVILEVATGSKSKRRAVAQLIRLKDSLGPVSRRVLRAGTIVASILAFVLLVAITPGDWTTG